MSRRIGVVTSSEVSVVGGNDGVSLTLLDVLSVPLTYTVSESADAQKR